LAASSANFLASLYALAGAFVEQMHGSRVRLQADPVTRIELVAFAEHGNDLFAAELMFSHYPIGEQALAAQELGNRR